MKPAGIEMEQLWLTSFDLEWFEIQFDYYCHD